MGPALDSLAPSAQHRLVLTSEKLKARQGDSRILEEAGVRRSSSDTGNLAVPGDCACKPIHLTLR